MKRAWTSLVGIALAIAPSVALACPVCGDAPARSRAAYLAMTIVLSLLPLGAMGALIWVAVRRLRRAEQLDDAARAHGKAAAALLRGGSPVPVSAPRARS